MRDYKKDARSINKDYTSTYFALYMQGEWGIEVGYKPAFQYIADMKKSLLDIQLAADCCSLCTNASQSIVINSYAGLNPHPCEPFVPLYPGWYGKPCSVIKIVNS